MPIVSSASRQKIILVHVSPAASLMKVLGGTSMTLGPRVAGNTKHVSIWLRHYESTNEQHGFVVSLQFSDSNAEKVRAAADRRRS